MASLTTWLRSRWTSTVEDIWCVHCRARRTVRRIEIATARSTRGLYRRLVGQCTICQGRTSTFVPDED